MTTGRKCCSLFSCLSLSSAHLLLSGRYLSNFSGFYFPTVTVNSWEIERFFFCVSLFVSSPISYPLWGQTMVFFSRNWQGGLWTFEREGGTFPVIKILLLSSLKSYLNDRDSEQLTLFFFYFVLFYFYCIATFSVVRKIWDKFNLFLCRQIYLPVASSSVFKP